VDRKILSILLFLISISGIAQDIIPMGMFHKDSVKIGEELPYSLWVRYPKDKDVVFPDSLFDFSPFELDKREYFTTKSDSLESLDSVVYYLSTFEIDTVQSIVLPIFIINEFDSTTFYTSLDSIILNQVVVDMPDSVAVLVNTAYQKVPLAFNYPYFTVGLVGLILVAIIGFFAFGKRIRRWFRIFWLTRRHKKFINSFQTILNKQPIRVEDTFSSWKKYLEKLEAQPITKLTSKELILLFDSSSLSDQLQIIDRNIYANDKSSDIGDAFDILMQFTIEQFHQKVKDIKNG
jgi:hypothetical protein